MNQPKKRAAPDQGDRSEQTVSFDGLDKTNGISSATNSEVVELLRTIGDMYANIGNAESAGRCFIKADELRGL